MTTARLSRRSLLQISSAVGGGLVVGFVLPPTRHVHAKDSVAKDSAEALFAPDAFIRIDRNGRITLIMPQVEMGQGIYTAMAQLVAEELDVPLESISLEAAPPDRELYANPAIGDQITGGSTSVRAFWPVMRKAGASARNILIQAAAKKLQVGPETLHTEAGTVVSSDGKKLSYAELVDDAAGLKPAVDVKLKDPSAFKLIGKPVKRLDTPDKVNGKAIYGIDVRLQDMKYATLASCPVFGGKVRHVDQRAALKIPGVRQVVVLDDLVAVVGDHMWAAKQGLEALDVDWDQGPHAALDSHDIWNALRRDAQLEGRIAHQSGDPKAKAGDGADAVSATYELPLLAHAPLEPMNCTVHVGPTSCEIWIGNQVLARAKDAAAAASGVPADRITVHNHLIGGGFGRRLEVDMVTLATRIAKHVDGPVKVVWTREEDIQHDMYRPLYHNQLTARLENGKPVAWSHQVTASSIMSRFAPPAMKNGVDPDAVEGAVELAYDIPNRTVRYMRSEPPAIPTAFWRGVGPNNNVFAVESFIDRLAKAAGSNPLEFRRSLLGKDKRALAALDLAAEKAGWGEALPARSGRGISLQSVFGSYVVTIAQVRVGEDGQVKVERLTTAVDCGSIVNPDTVVAQIQGGLIFGLTAALYGEITLDRGRVQQSNFNDYRMIRINETPKIEVHLVHNQEAPGGIGEPGTTSVQAAVNNAIFAATGTQLDRMPVDQQRLRLRSAA